MDEFGILVLVLAFVFGFIMGANWRNRPIRKLYSVEYNDPKRRDVLIWQFFAYDDYEAKTIVEIHENKINRKRPSWCKVRYIPESIKCIQDDMENGK